MKFFYLLLDHGWRFAFIMKAAALPPALSARKLVVRQIAYRSPRIAGIAEEIADSGTHKRWQRVAGETACIKTGS